MPSTKLLTKIREQRNIDWVFVAILLLAAFMDSWQIWKIGMTNDFYMTTVTNMLKNFHNFWFASFNTSNQVVTINQPPVALWLMAGSAKLFGLHVWSVLLPSVMFGIGSVALMYQLVKPTFGVAAGRLAALALTLTPVFVASSRSNSLDATLIFFLLLALRLLQCATQRQQLRWLLLSFGLIGIAFNVKLLQAFMILPAMVGFYWFSTHQTWQRRLMHLVIATAVLTITTLAWPLSVDYNAQQSGQHNHVTFALTFNYQANNQLLSQTTSADHQPSQQRKSNVGTTPITTTHSGLLSIIQDRLGSQISWFLPFAILGALGGFSFYRDPKRKWYQLADKQRHLALWTGWGLCAYVSFALAGSYQLLYLPVLAPPIAALFGITLGVIVQQYHRASMNQWQYYLLPLAIVSTASLQAWYIYQFYPPVSWLMLLLGAIVGLVLISSRQKRAIRWLIAVGMTTIILGPIWWSLTPALTATANATASPALFSSTKQRGNTSTTLNQKLLTYLQKHQNGTQYLFATDHVATAAPYIVSSNQSVLTVGADGISLTTFKQLVAAGAVKYFYVADHSDNTAVTTWVKQNGDKVTSGLYQSKTKVFPPKSGSERLYHKPTKQPRPTNPSNGTLYRLSTTQ